ncbi:MAG: hypothetical protein VB125_02190 [Burkholderia sp.]
MLVRSPSVLPEIEDMGITSPSRSFMQQRRPRKSLGWKCPAELFMPESFAVRQHHHEIVVLGDALRAQRAPVALRS